MKDRFNYTRVKMLPLLACVSGPALLLGAWPLAALMPAHDNSLLLVAGMTLWLLCCVAFMLFHVPPRLARRYGLVLALFMLSAVPFRSDYAQTLAAQFFSFAGLLLLAAGLCKAEAIHRYLRLLNRPLRRWQGMSPRMFTEGAFVVFLAIAIGLSWYCFRFLPGYTDSTAQYVHAKFVASGHLTSIPGHRLREFFPVWLMVHATKWYSQYPPMHQTLLGLGFMLDAPWLINPLEGALTLLALYAIAKRVYGEKTARLASLLMLTSPFIVLMSSEFMNHASALLFTTLLIWTYTELQAALARGNKAYYWAAAAGLSAGCIFLSRPFTALGVGLPFALHACYRLWRDGRAYRMPFLLMATGGTVCVLFQLWYNAQTTGDMFLYAYTRYHSGSLSSAMGYHKEGTPLTTLVKLQGEWFKLNIDLFAWSLPCAFFAMLVCLRPMPHLTTRLLVSVVVSQTLINMFNQFSNTVFGPRYLYEISTALIILTAVGIRRVPALLASLHLRMPQDARGAAMALMTLLICATGLINRVPGIVKSYTHFMDSHPQFYQSMLAQSQPPALIFMGRHGGKDKGDLDATFRWTAWTNPPLSDAPVIFARDRGDAKNRELIRYYPDRKAYVEQRGKLTPVPGTPFIKPLPAVAP